MQKDVPTITPGLLGGIAASLLLHGGLLGVKAFNRPAVVEFDSGEVAVELTLVPSIASMALPPPAVEPQPVEEKPTPVEPAPALIEPDLPAPIPADQETEPVAKMAEAASDTPEPAPPQPEPVVQESIDALEQDGALETDKGAVSEAQIQSKCSPVYPRISRRLGEEGVVVLSIEVSPEGIGSNIRIITSSGHSRLDQAAITAMKKARFTPAMRRGQPHTSTLTRTFNFQLTNAQ